VYLRFGISLRIFITYLLLEGIAVVFCWRILACYFFVDVERENCRRQVIPGCRFASNLDMQEMGEEEANIELYDRISDGDETVRNELADVIVKLR